VFRGAGLALAASPSRTDAVEHSEREENHKRGGNILSVLEAMM